MLQTYLKYHDAPQKRMCSCPSHVAGGSSNRPGENRHDENPEVLENPFTKARRDIKRKANEIRSRRIPRRRKSVDSHSSTLTASRSSRSSSSSSRSSSSTKKEKPTARTTTRKTKLDQKKRPDHAKQQTRSRSDSTEKPPPQNENKNDKKLVTQEPCRQCSEPQRKQTRRESTKSCDCSECKRENENQPKKQKPQTQKKRQDLRRESFNRKPKLLKEPLPPADLNKHHDRKEEKYSKGSKSSSAEVSECPDIDALFHKYKPAEKQENALNAPSQPNQLDSKERELEQHLQSTNTSVMNIAALIVQFGWETVVKYFQRQNPNKGFGGIFLDQLLERLNNTRNQESK